jgi:hypothetical protein
VIEELVIEKEPGGYPDRVVFTVTLEEVPGGKFETVTSPDPSTTAVPDAVAVAVHE